MRVLVLLLILVTTASAQPELPPEPRSEQPAAVDPGSSETLTPTKVDSSGCLPLDLTPGALVGSTRVATGLATPIPWSEFEVRGSLLEETAVVHALLEPTLQEFRTSLTEATLPQVATITARFGYQLIGHTLQDVTDGTKLILTLAPLPLVRKVDVDITDQPWFGKILDDEVRRRMSLRRGSYLPWDSIRQTCVLLDEQRRIQEYLFDEGYFDATVDLQIQRLKIGPHYADVRVNVRLFKKDEAHRKYDIGKVTVSCPAGADSRNGRCYDSSTGAHDELPLSAASIKSIFKHPRLCLIGSICLTGGGYSRSQYQDDIQTVRSRMQTLGYPGARVQASDPRTTIDRRKDKKTVNPVITIDPRRRVEVQFEGYDESAVSDADLRKQLTFNAAGSADDVEAGDSARALTTFLQTRGFFDAHVTFTREPVDLEPKPGTNDLAIHMDRVHFLIDLGHVRRVAKIEFVGNMAITSATLRNLVATKVANLGGVIFGTSAAATSSELILDVERIKEAYRRAGFPNATVWPSASVSAAGLDNSAMTAALVGLGTGSDLYVRFTIDEGEPTLLTRIVVAGENDKPLEDALCAEVLGELATELGDRDVARRSDPANCIATIAGLKFRYDDVAGTRDTLRDFLLKAGRARSEVEYAATPFGVNRMEAHYTVKHAERLKLGQVIIRGAYHTNGGLIRDELRLTPGDILTTDRLAEAARRLRNTGLFEAVNIDMPDLDCANQQRSCNSDTINAVVRVEERYIQRIELGLEGGLSSLNGFFSTLRWTQGNVAGRGILFRASGTFGTKLSEVEGTLRFPQYISRALSGHHLAFTTELTGLYRQQDTDRFGLLTTKGATLGISKQWPHTRTETHPAYSRGIGLAYDFRVRIRNLDALRPIGANMDDSQVAVSTRTGLIRLNAEWEQRVDRSGQLAPLAPEDGFRLEASFAVASTKLLGQYDFLKFSGYAAKFIPIGKNLVLRMDGRYDQGIPLGGAVLLPDVERLFAGGDSTVRGYAEDRLKTEIIQVGVPPLDNISQIRIIPVGGNIRALASVDAQVRIWKILAGALFSDAGVVTNSWRTTTVDDIRPSIGMGLRALTPFGIGALEYAVPIRPHLGDDPRGRIHFYFAARAQF